MEEFIILLQSEYIFILRCYEEKDLNRKQISISGPWFLQVQETGRIFIVWDDDVHDVSALPKARKIFPAWQDALFFPGLF